MSLAAELKRRLEYDNEPIGKRLKLAQNVITYPLFPVENRGEIVIEWLCTNMEDDNFEQLKKIIASLKNCVKVVNFKASSFEIKSKLLKVLMRHLEEQTIKYQNDLKPGDLNADLLECCLDLIENPTVNLHFQQYILEYFSFLFQLFRNILCHKNVHKSVSKNDSLYIYEDVIKRAIFDLRGFVRSFNKKIMLVDPFLKSKLIWAMLELTDDENFSSKALSMCQTIVFPATSVPLFKRYLTILIQGGSLNPLIEEKGEILKPIVSTMNIFFKHSDLLKSEDGFVQMLKLFLYSYKYDSNIIFMFVVTLYKHLGINQDYIEISNTVTTVDANKSLVKKIHLNNLIFLLNYNVNLNLKYPLESGNLEGEAKKDFITFIQRATVGLFVDEPIDSLYLSVIKRAFLLDPGILEPIIETMLPNIIVQKKKNKDPKFLSLYNEVMILILDIMYKMSRGPELLQRILPLLKEKLESVDSVQQKYIDKARDESNVKSKIYDKIIDRDDMFSDEFCDRFGKLASDLVYWQHLNLLTQLTDSIDTFCLKILKKNEATYPSVLLLCEILCSLLSSFYHHSKIADHNVPEGIFNKFKKCFELAGTETLKKLGDICMKFPNEIRLMKTFLRISQNYGHLSLLLWRYRPDYLSNVNIGRTNSMNLNTSHISDITALHFYFDIADWKKIYKLVLKKKDKICINSMNTLILQNVVASEILVSVDPDLKNISNVNENTRNYIMKNFDEIWTFLIQSDFYICAIFNHLTLDEMKALSKKMIEAILKEDENLDCGYSSFFILRSDYIKAHKPFLSTLVIEYVRNIWIHFDQNIFPKHQTTLYEASDANDFNIAAFLQSVNDQDALVDRLISSNVLKNKDALRSISKVLNVLDKLPVQYLKEETQNAVIFTIVVLRSAMLSDGTQMNTCEDASAIETICKSSMMRIFELALKVPNIFDIFSARILADTVEKKFFQFTLPCGDVDLFDLFKHILVGTVSKDNVDHLKNFTASIVEMCKINEDEKYTAEIFTKESFQALSLVYSISSGVKKSNMSSEMKSTITTIQSDSADVICQYINSVKWKKEIENGIQMETRETIAIMNIMESYSAILSYHCRSKDASKLKKLSKPLKFIVSVALKLMQREEIVLLHAKGSCSILNVLLKHDKTLSCDSIFEDRHKLFSEIWTASGAFMKTIGNKIGSGWTEASTLATDNLVLLCEMCDVKFFSTHLAKESLGAVGLSVARSAEAARVTRKLWFCFLNANLKAAGKNEARSAIVGRTTKDFFLRLRSSDGDGEGRETSTEDVERIVLGFEIITEFVSTKKMILSNFLIDMIVQMPAAVSFEATTEEAFCVLFEKCSRLLDGLLAHRSEMLQDRWPAFLQSYRRLASALCARSDRESQATEGRLVALAVGIERMTRTMAKSAKRDVSRIGAYVVADLVAFLRGVAVRPLVKFHVEKCIESLMQLLDNHAVGFLMRNATDAGRMTFQQMYDDYKKYHKFVGAS